LLCLKHEWCWNFFGLDGIYLVVEELNLFRNGHPSKAVYYYGDTEAFYALQAMLRSLYKSRIVNCDNAWQNSFNMLIREVFLCSIVGEQEIASNSFSEKLSEWGTDFT
jgi:hypothetical protein